MAQLCGFALQEQQAMTDHLYRQQCSVTDICAGI